MKDGPTSSQLPAMGFIIAGDETYGVSRFISSLIDYWISNGTSCSVFSLVEGPLAQRCRDAGASVEISDLGPPPNYGTRGVAALAAFMRLSAYSAIASLRISRWLSRAQVARIIVRTPNLVPMSAVASRVHSVPAIWVLPNDVSDRYPLGLNKKLYDILFKVTGLRPVANSAYTKGTLANRLVEADVVHLGVDSKFFDSDAICDLDRQSLGLRSEDIVFGLFARVTPDKGQLEVVEALSLLRSSSRVKILIVGGPVDGEFGRGLKARASELGVCDRVVFAGPATDVRPYYKLCDVVLNARRSPEPFGLSVIEAMMMQKPVLAHKAGGPSETVVDGRTGWLVHEATAESFAAGFMRALDDRPRWSWMGGQGRARALAEYDIPVVARRIAAVVVPQ